MNPALPFEVTVAVRFLREGRLQTWFIVGGIAIGVGVIVFMSAMLAGLERNFLRRILGSQAHIQILAPEAAALSMRAEAEAIVDTIVQRPAQRLVSIDQWRRIAEEIRTIPGIDAVSPVVVGSVLALRGDVSRSIVLTGVDPAEYFRIVRVPEYIAAGEARLTSETAVIGIELARDLGVGIDDKIVVRAASGAARTLTIGGLL
ncbi:MAG: ABC transporter permease, partial [Azospirillum sp.]|nr:ABC transporter permease [Azospirillum sp.]